MSSIVHIRRNAFQKVMGAGVLLFLVSGCTMAANSTMAVHSVITDDRGKPVRDAVVYATPKERMAPAALKTVLIVKNSELHPFVLPVRTGTSVSFLNRDKVQHHVYSVSPAKKFYLPLDKGASSEPIALDTAGVIVLGCAIHDGVVGYLYVLETAYFAKTGEEGTADLIGLPRGTYEVRVWHPLMKGPPEATAKRIVPSSQGDADVNFVITLKNRGNREPLLPASAPEHRGG